jgi:hypothetical protein
MAGVFVWLRHAFVDMRYVLLVMVLWLMIICTVLCELGLLENSRFVSFGPRPTLQFMHMTIDTPYKYGMLVLLIVAHTFITECLGDSLGPHMLNVVQDPKHLQLPHSHLLYYAITTVWCMYCSVSQLIVIFLVLAQLDLLLVRLGSELLANAMTTSIYLIGKKHAPGMYHHMAELPTPSCSREPEPSPL